MAKTQPTAEYGFYSKLLKQPFDTVEELISAEKEYNEKHAKELALKEEKKNAALCVENAYKEYLAAMETARREVDKARRHYIETRQDFIKKYGYYHATYTNENGGNNIEVEFNSAFDGLSDLFSKIFEI